MNTQSTESCSTCAQGSSSIPGAIGHLTSGMTNPGDEKTTQQGDAGFTYDEGGGVKNRVVLTGPLSEMLGQQLNVVFAKTPIGDKPEAVTDLDKPQDGQANQPPGLAAVNQTVETIAIDSAIIDASDQLANQQDNQVLLQNFDVVSLKEHLKRVDADSINDKDRIEAGARVNALVVGSAQDLLETDVESVMAATGADAVDMLLVEEIKPGPIDIEQGPSFKSVLFKGKAPQEAPDAKLGDQEQDRSEGSGSLARDPSVPQYIESNVLGGKGSVFTSMEAYFKAKLKAKG